MTPLRRGSLSVLALLVVTACPERPVPADTDTGAPASTSSTLTGGDTTSESSPTTFATATTDVSTTTDASTSTSTTSPMTEAASTGNDALCGPPCDRTWEHMGTLQIFEGEDLSQFACLTRVHGDLLVQGNYDATAMAVFANLRHVESLSLESNDMLTDLSAFSCLRQVDESLSLSFMPALTDLSGLSNVSSAPRLKIVATGAVALPAFAPEFTGVQRLSLTDNPALKAVDAAAQWSSVGGELYLSFSGSPALTSIEPFANLVGSATTELRIGLSELSSLTSLKGLESATGGAVFLRDLPLIPDLKPLAALGTVSPAWVDLGGLPLVTSLKGLGGENKLLSSLAIGGVCDWGQDFPGMDGLMSLAGLDGVTSLQNLWIANNMALSSLAGAESLTSVGDLSLINNPKLGQQAIEDFLAGLTVQDSCVGGWDQCNCPLMP